MEYLLGMTTNERRNSIILHTQEEDTLYGKDYSELRPCHAYLGAPMPTVNSGSTTYNCKHFVTPNCNFVSSVLIILR